MNTPRFYASITNSAGVTLFATNHEGSKCGYLSAYEFKSEFEAETAARRMQSDYPLFSTIAVTPAYF